MHQAVSREGLIFAYSVHGATDHQHAMAVGVKHGALLVQRDYLCNFPISRNTGTLKRQQEELGQKKEHAPYQIHDPQP